MSITIDNKTFDYYKKLVSIDGLYIEHIPKNHRLCRIAILENPLAIQYLNEKEQTAELCSYSIKDNFKALKYIKNKKFKEDYIKNGTLEDCILNDATYLVDIPKEYQTLTMCLNAVYSNHLMFKYVSIQTPEMCKYAIFREPMLLEYVQDEFKTKELCDLAISLDKNAEKFAKVLIDEAKNTELYYINRLSIDGLGLQYIKEPTYGMCMTAINNNGLALQYVPAIYKHDELLLMAVKQNVDAVKYIK
jgi:hypothetical protein